MNSRGAYIYLLYGDDDFSRDEVVRSLKERMCALPAGEHNLTELAPEEASVSALRAHADAAPFLAERRMVIVRGLIGRLQGKAEGTATRRRAGSRGGGKAAEKATGPNELQALLDYLPTVPFETSIAFVEGAKITVEPISAAIPDGRAFVREYPRDRDVAGWIRRRAKLLEVDLDESAVRELAFLGGEDLRRLNHEIEKLGAYADGRTVTRTDVQELVLGRDLVMWTLLDALAERRRDGALRALRRLIAQGESAEKLLGADIVPLYQRLLAAKELSLLDRRARANVDLAALRLNPRALPKLNEQVARFDPPELERALELLLDLDRAIKTGETEPEAGLEVTIVKLCSRLSATPAGSRAED